MKPYEIWKHVSIGGGRTHCDAMPEQFTGRLDDSSGSFYYLRGLDVKSELRLLGYLYKENPTPELMALIMELR